MFSSTECGKFGKGRINQVFTEPINLGNGTLSYMEAKSQERVKNTKLKLRKDIREDLSKIIKVPWFYACNKNRYPSWEGKHDSRVT